MKTILIPTDFSLSSLNCISGLCSGQKEKEVSLVFLHMFSLSDSIGDLLMLSRRSREYSYVSDEFYRSCEELKRELPQLHSIRIEFFYGSTMSMFKNFIEHHDISHILHADFCCCQALNKNSIDPAGLINRCGLPAIKAVIEKKQAKEVALDPLALEEQHFLAESMA